MSEGQDQSREATRKLSGAWSAGLTAEDLITLNDEIAGMARAGLPFEQIFLDFKMRIPLFTEWVFALSHHPTYLISAPAILLAMIIVIWLVLRSSGRGRIAWARWLYMFPIFGLMIRAARLAAFTDL